MFACVYKALERFGIIDHVEDTANPHSVTYSQLPDKPTIPDNTDYVDLTTAQTVAGEKTFTDTIRPAGVSVTAVGNVSIANGKLNVTKLDGTDSYLNFSDGSFFNNRQVNSYAPMASALFNATLNITVSGGEYSNFKVKTELRNSSVGVANNTLNGFVSEFGLLVGAGKGSNKVNALSAQISSGFGSSGTYGEVSLISCPYSSTWAGASNTIGDFNGINISDGVLSRPFCTNVTGIRIPPIGGSVGTNKRGIWLRGDEDTGGDLVLGGSSLSRIYSNNNDGLLVLESAQTSTTGGRVKNTTRVTTTYQILTTDDVVFCNTGASYTATLPTGVEGQTLKIINSGTSGFILTIAPASGEKLLGVINDTFLLNDGETLELTYNASDGWY